MGHWLSSSVSEDLLEMVKLVWVGDVQHGCSGFELAWVQAVALLLVHGMCRCSQAQALLGLESSII
jgi:hypothetical protein